MIYLKRSGMEFSKTGVNREFGINQNKYIRQTCLTYTLCKVYQP